MSIARLSLPRQQTPIYFNKYCCIRANILKNSFSKYLRRFKVFTSKSFLWSRQSRENSFMAEKILYFNFWDMIVCCQTLGYSTGYLFSLDSFLIDELKSGLKKGYQIWNWTRILCHFRVFKNVLGTSLHILQIPLIVNMTNIWWRPYRIWLTFNQYVTRNIICDPRGFYNI